MTLADISDLSQAIAAVAVVVSLIYLALQTRQTAINQRAMMHAERLHHVRELMLRAGDADFAPIMLAATAAAPDMSAHDVARFSAYARTLLTSMQEQFLDWRGKLIDDDRWKLTRDALAALLGTPGYRASYRLWRNIGAHPAFRVMADELLAKGQGAPQIDVTQAWLALAAEERAALTQGGTP
jgi:hypothetical protein